MAYAWGEHVGELELHVEAATEHEVFSEAARAFGELLVADDDAPAGPPIAVEVRAEGRDRAAQLAEWLDELIFLAETEGFVPEAVEALELSGGAVRARVTGRRGAPPHLVKAATRHRLAFEEAAAGWQASMVLDV
jgi:SHS2 domain-containing protein